MATVDSAAGGDGAGAGAGAGAGRAEVSGGVRGTTGCGSGYKPDDGVVS